MASPGLPTYFHHPAVGAGVCGFVLFVIVAAGWAAGFPFLQVLLWYSLFSPILVPAGLGDDPDPRIAAWAIGLFVVFPWLLLLFTWLHDLCHAPGGRCAAGLPF